MAENDTKQELYLTQLKTTIDIGTVELTEINVTEVNLTESLLTPGLQTNVVVQNKLSSNQDIPKQKNLNNFYAKPIKINVKRPIIDSYAGGKDYSELEVYQIIYRLSKRRRLNYDVETFELDACDPSLIKDAKTFLSKSWPCSTSSQVVSDILRGCIGAPEVDIESSNPAREYVATNIHPFQAIYQNSEVALSSQQDPSFVHFMTYRNGGTHHFRSLTSLASQSEVWRFVYSDKGSADASYANPFHIMKYDFPCDFDLLSDVLNGYDENGNDITVMSSINPLTGTFGMFGQATDCGNTPYMVSSITGTESDQGVCNPNIEKYLIKRKPRMALLDQDKIALKLTVPFSPFLHAGDVIDVAIPDKGPLKGELYGSGKYLISSMTHNIKAGGLGITTLECVSNTVAAGKV
jgi:hypothetical protein